MELNSDGQDIRKSNWDEFFAKYQALDQVDTEADTSVDTIIVNCGKLVSPSLVKKPKERYTTVKTQTIKPKNNSKVLSAPAVQNSYKPRARKGLCPKSINIEENEKKEIPQREKRVRSPVKGNSTVEVEQNGTNTKRDSKLSVTCKSSLKRCRGRRKSLQTRAVEDAPETSQSIVKSQGRRGRKVIHTVVENAKVENLLPEKRLTSPPQNNFKTDLLRKTDRPKRINGILDVDSSKESTSCISKQLDTNISTSTSNESIIPKKRGRLPTKNNVYNEVAEHIGNTKAPSPRKRGGPKIDNNIGSDVDSSEQSAGSFGPLEKTPTDVDVDSVTFADSEAELLKLKAAIEKKSKLGRIVFKRRRAQVDGERLYRRHKKYMLKYWDTALKKELKKLCGLFTINELEKYMLYSLQTQLQESLK